MAWYRKAAEQEGAMAQHNLGSMYELGNGVSQDYVEAYQWLSLAVAGASAADHAHYAEARDALAQKLTAAQVAEAQKRASEWTAAFEKRKK